VYSVDSNGFCEANDFNVAELIWPGTNSICYGEVVSFSRKR
jgi:hypothetical protein